MKWFFFILIGLILSTCTKLGENIYVKGKVINPVTGKGIPGVEIALQKKTTFEYATGYKPVETVTTDANGDFEIRHLGGFKQYYLNCLYSTAYHPIGWYVNGEFKDSYLTKIKKGKKNEVEFQMVPFGKLNYTIKNISCNGNTDTLRRYLSYSLDYYSGIQNPSVYSGCVDFPFSSSVELPIGNWYMKWEVIKNGILNTFYDTVFLEENQLKTVEFYY